MQDHLAADTDEQALIEVPEPKAWHVRFARYVSHVLAPARFLYHLYYWWLFTTRVMS